MAGFEVITEGELHFALEYIFKNWRLQMQEAAKFKATVQRWSDSSTTPGKAE